MRCDDYSEAIRAEDDAVENLQARKMHHATCFKEARNDLLGPILMCGSARGLVDLLLMAWTYPTDAQTVVRFRVQAAGLGRQIRVRA